MCPELALEKGTVTDPSGREFIDTSALQYAFWAMDWQMCTMIIKKMLELPAGKQAIEEQLSVFQDGRQGLTFSYDHDVNYREIKNTLEKGRRIKSKRYDANELIEALVKYSCALKTHYNLEHFWCKVVVFSNMK